MTSTNRMLGLNLLFPVDALSITLTLVIDMYYTLMIVNIEYLRM